MSSEKAKPPGCGAKVQPTRTRIPDWRGKTQELLTLTPKMAFIKNNKSETHLSLPGFPHCTASLLSTTEGKEHLPKHNKRELSSPINHTRGIVSSRIHPKYHRAHDETTKLGSKCHLLLYAAGKEATFPMHLFTALLMIYISLYAWIH